MLLGWRSALLRPMTPGNLKRRLHVMIQILDAVMDAGTVILQESMHFHASFKSEKLLEIGFRQLLGPVPFERHGFERGPREIVASS